MHAWYDSGRHYSSSNDFAISTVLTAHAWCNLINSFSNSCEDYESTLFKHSLLLLVSASNNLIAVAIELRWPLKLSLRSWSPLLLLAFQQVQQKHRAWVMVSTARLVLLLKPLCSRRCPKSSTSFRASLLLSCGCTSTIASWGYARRVLAKRIN